MDKMINDCIADCEYYSTKLKNKMQNSRDDLPNCIKGELLDEYLRACDLAEERLTKINLELHKLQDCLELLDIQQSM